MNHEQATTYDRLYERAEEASNEGMPIETAFQAVRDGYSSAEMDRRIAREEDD